MRVEGLGTKRPAVKLVDIQSSWKRIAADESQKRNNRDRSSSSRWIKGISPKAHYIGVLIELAVADYLVLGANLSFGWDGGKDFSLHGIAVDAKGTQRLAVPAIRLTELDRHPNSIYVFGKLDSRCTMLALIGCATSGEMHRYKKLVDLPSGANAQPILEELHSVEQLKEKMTTRNVLRYPGGKTQIVREVHELMDFFGGLFAPKWYIEPFVGGGAMFCHLMNRGTINESSIWLNDIDRSLCLLYQAIRDKPKELCKLICAHTPSTESWYRAKEVDGTIDDPVKAGFAKLILHFCSAKGYGFCAGGPQGGKKQTGEYLIGCRWKPIKLIRRINKISSWLQGAKITNENVFDMDLPSDAFVFCDPPYVGAGGSLYRHSFTNDDHVHLRSLLDGCEHWAATYDDHDLIRNLYSDCSIRAFEMKSGNNAGKRKYNELVITPN